MRKIGLLLFLLAAPAWSADLAAIRERGFIKVGAYPDTPPFGYRDAAGEFQGFDVELAREIAQDLFGDRKKVQFVAVNTADRIPYLKTDEVDFVMAHFAHTPLRAQVIDFAEPYMKIESGVLSAKDLKLKSLDGFQGTLVLNKGTVAEGSAKALFPKLKMKSFVQNLDAFATLETQKNHVLVNDTAILFAYAHEHPNFEVSIDHLDKPVFVAPGLKKGNRELQQYLNEEIKTMRRDGRLLAVYDRILRPLYAPQVQPQQFLVLD